MSDAASSLDENEHNVRPTARGRWTRVNVLIRRVHLYAGLFLLPWVFLYGITGAMYNHEGLFPDATIVNVSASQLADSALMSFPTAEALAAQVVEALQEKSPEASVSLSKDHGAEYNNDVILEVSAGDGKHAVHIDPVAHSAAVVGLPANNQPARLLEGVHNVQLDANPYEVAKQSVSEIMVAAGHETSRPPRPRGWCKLNFLADIDGQQARVTYVLRDGHVDVTQFDGQHEMSARRFFMRLHTSHGQPPHWNGRMYWSLILDVMAIAMVTWGISGVIMWWQIKRTRVIGVVVILCSLATAAWLYLNMVQFYAATKL